MLKGLLVFCVGSMLFLQPGYAQEPVVQATSEVTEVAKEPESVPTAGFDKGFFIQSKDEKFRLAVGGYLQGLFLWDVLEGAKNADTFRVRRARLKFSGHLFSKKVGYQLEYDFAANKMLTTYLALTHSDALEVWLGQFKVPFNLESISSSSTLQFVDRSLAHSIFGVPDERDVGAELHGSLMNKKLEYNVGVFNGEGINKLNQNNEMRYSGRITFNALGHHGKEFADTKNSQEPQLALALAGFHNKTLDPTAAFEQRDASITTDVSAKYRGLGFHGAFFYRNINPNGATPTTSDKGFLAQLGYFVMPEKLEIGARVVQAILDGSGDKAEYTAGVNYYLFGGHRVKLQCDYSVLTEKDGIAAGNNQVDQRVRAQIQVKI